VVVVFDHIAHNNIGVDQCKLLIELQWYFLIRLFDCCDCILQEFVCGFKVTVFQFTVSDD